MNTKSKKLELRINSGEHLHQLFQPLYEEEEEIRVEIKEEFTCHILLKFRPRFSWFIIILLGLWFCAALYLGLNHWKTRIPSLLLLIITLYGNMTKYILYPKSENQ
jgi:hypothetical protein